VTAGAATVLRADARSIPLPDASVDLVVTSPPYFALRSYTDGGEHYAAQIGGEPTPQEYIASLIECTREWMRVLKPSGSIFVNLGDKYVTYEGPRTVPQNSELGRRQGAASQETARYVRSAPTAYGLPYKSQMNLPERYRIACTDELGLIQRAKIVWSKPNGLPESVTDRVRCSHEDWVHLTKAPRYFSAVDEIREAHARRWTPGNNGGTRPALVGSGSQYDGLAASGPNPLGKLPGSVWEIATEPLKVPDHLGVNHFAAFPTEWPRRIIAGWSPSGICTACDEGRRPVTSLSRRAADPFAATQLAPGNGRGWHGGDPAKSSLGVRAHETDRRILGEACACPEPTAPTRPAVVLDPFGGTGTTALVAKVLGRHGISVDRSADYCRLARWRTTDPGQLAKAMRVPQPPKALDGQGDLFGVAS
jgi:DNA modification methylase